MGIENLPNNDFIIAFSLLLIWTSLLLVPGPDFFLMLRNTLKNGYKAGLFTGLGITLAIGIHVSLAIFGLLILSKNSWLYLAVQIAGAVYLLYIGLSSILKEKDLIVSNMENNACLIAKKQNFFKEGFFCNILNPKAPILMIGIFSQLIPYSSTVSEKIFFGSEIVAINLIVWSLFSYFIGSKFITNRLNNFTKEIHIFSNLILILLGGSVIVHIFL